MHKILAYIHLEGPMIKVAEALIPEKPTSLGWLNRDKCWAFTFNKEPSKSAIQAAHNTGLIYQKSGNRVIIALPGIKEHEINKAKQKFGIFADEYKSLSKRVASIINRSINENSRVIKTIPIKMNIKWSDYRKVIKNSI